MDKTKKILAVLLAFALVFSLAACGSQKTDEENASAGSGTESDTGSAAADFDYSGALDENGMWKGVRALDHVTLCDYSDIVIKQSDIDSEIEYFLTYFSDEVKVMDRAVQDGDYVNIDYVGTIGGVEFEGGNTQGKGTTVIIGYTHYIEGFLDQVVGHKPGETFDVNVTFPDDYSDTAVAGRDAVFKTTVNYITEYHQAEFSDDFVETNMSGSYGWHNVEEMVNGIANNLATTYIYDNSKISEVPDAMVDYQVDAAVAYYKVYAGYYGVSFEEFLKTYAQASTEQAFREAQHDSAYDSASYYLLYQALVEDMGLSVSDKDVTAYFSNLGTTDLDTMVKTYGMPYLKNQLLIEKVNDEIKARTSVTNAEE